MLKKTMRIAGILAHIVTFVFLTVLTQVGGIIYLLSRLTHPHTDRIIFQRTTPGIRQQILRPIAKIAIFIVIYIFSAILVIPLLAKPFGRTTLPVISRHNLQPLHIMTCLLNRHYVKPALKDAAIDITKKMNRRYPGTHVNYLDAGFPFFDNFPLLPHLSHNDGKKLDLSFLYISKVSGQPSDDTPSVIGYGVCEEPRPGEVNTAASCQTQGYRWYSALKMIVPQGNKDKFVFDSVRTRALMNIITFNSSIHKVFIEPHLQARLKLESSKIRFHGCGAVRHDDHIHIQL